MVSEQKNICNLNLKSKHKIKFEINIKIKFGQILGFTII